MSLRQTRQLAALVVVLLASASLCKPYYYYVHYLGKNGTAAPSYEKFDTNALFNRTALFYIHDPSAVQLSANDTVSGLISQIRAGAKVWNDVATSELRVAYGGIVPVDIQHDKPSIEIQFDEMPPGVLAYGGPEVLADPQPGVVPIQRAHVVLNKDLTSRPSYSEGFFGTLVHEFGHALGLQHAFTSATMATEITRATTKAKPLAADDIAGLSALYPTKAWKDATGSITGRVTGNGDGIHLASVVAIAPNGVTVGTLTLPDGSYHLDGLQPGKYMVYVHALPPALTQQGQSSAGNLTYPLDSDGKSVDPGRNIETLFYPSARDAKDATLIEVKSGAITEKIDVASKVRGTPGLHSVQTFGFPGQIAIKPPYLAANFGRTFLVATGTGLMPNGAPVPNLSVGILGGRILSAKTYSQSNQYAQIDVDVKASYENGGVGPRHLIFTTPNDVYVLPAGFMQTLDGPPSITAINAGDNGMALLTGARLNDRTTVLFDGVPGITRGVDGDGRLLVQPPAADAKMKANLVALNSDGQSSLFLTNDPLRWNYDAGIAAPVLSMTPDTLPASAEAAVVIDAPGANFVDGQVSVNFTSPEIQTRQVWVVSPTRVIAAVTTSGDLQNAHPTMMVTSGLQVITAAAPVIAQAARAKAPVLDPSFANTDDGIVYLYPGSSVLVKINGPVVPSGSNVQVFLNDVSVPAYVTADNTVLFTLPSSLALGPVVVRAQVAGQTTLPIAVVLSPAPANIVSTQVNGGGLDSGRGVHAGDTLSLLVSGLAPAGSDVAIWRVSVALGDARITPSEVKTSDDKHLITFTVPDGLKAGGTPAFVIIDGRASHRISLPLQ